MGTEKRERQKANRALKHQQEMQAASRKKLYRKIGLVVAAVAAVVLFVWIASMVVGDDDAPTPPATVPATLPDVTVPDVTVPDVTTATSEG